MALSNVSRMVAFMKASPKTPLKLTLMKVSFISISFIVSKTLSKQDLSSVLSAVFSESFKPYTLASKG